MPNEKKSRFMLSSSAVVTGKLVVKTLFSNLQQKKSKTIHTLTTENKRLIATSICLLYLKYMGGHL